MKLTSPWLWSWLTPSFLVVTVLSSEASAHLISQIRRNPHSFDQQTVTVTGEVAHVVTRYGEAPYTTFDLVNDKGAALSILVSKTPQCLQGDVCRVSGLFVAEKNIILPEKIERVSEAGYEEAGVLFRRLKSKNSRKRAKYGNGGSGSPSSPDGRLPRGMFMPE